MLRLLQPPSPEVIEELNRDFSDIITEGVIEAIDPTPAEVRDGDALECSRLAFAFNRRDIGRLRLLVDRLNDIVKAEPAELHPPPRFTP